MGYMNKENSPFWPKAVLLLILAWVAFGWFKGTEDNPKLTYSDCDSLSKKDRMRCRAAIERNDPEGDPYLYGN